MNALSRTLAATALVGSAWLGSSLQAQSQVLRLYGVDIANRLVMFSSTDPGNASSMAITGLAAGEVLVGLDFRPKDGRLYAVGKSSRIYTVDVSTAKATMVGDKAFMPALTGSAFGVDFNPVPDLLRTHSDGDQNLRLHPDTGAAVDADASTDGIQPDAVLAYASSDAAGQNPNLVGTAYTNSVSGATATTLYAIDSASEVLVTLPTPNKGQISTVGALGVATTDAVGFDIAPFSNAAFATLSEDTNKPSNLYNLNLKSGKATLIGRVGSVAPLVGVAIAP
jgi:hypothetical protein